MSDPSGKFVRSAHQVSCKIDEELAVLDLDRAIYFGIQGAGVQVWEALELPRSVEDLCAVVMAEFDVSEDVCRADVTQLLTDLQKEGLVEAAG